MLAMQEGSVYRKADKSCKKTSLGRRRPFLAKLTIKLFLLLALSSVGRAQTFAPPQRSTSGSTPRIYIPVTAEKDSAGKKFDLNKPQEPTGNYLAPDSHPSEYFSRGYSDSITESNSDEAESENSDKSPSSVNSR